MCGAQCVMTPGKELMLQWCVDNSDFLLKVCIKKTWMPLVGKINFICQQMQSLSVPLSLVLVLVQSTWTMLTVLAVRLYLLTAHTVHLSAVTLAIEVLE